LDTRTLTRNAAAPAAHLLIHADAQPGVREPRGESPLQRLRSLYAGGARHDERAPLALRIDDLRGQSMLAVEDAWPAIDVILPPGTYHITARLGELRRGYTVTLESGRSFDLYLRLAPAH